MTVGPILAILAAAQASLADGPSIDLRPLDPRHPFTETRNYSARCGSSVVKVLGVAQEYSGLFRVDPDAGRVVVRRPGLRGAEVSVDLGNGLSDHNGIACIERNGRPLVVVWSDCGGSACGRGYNFTIIDAATPRILAPARGTRWCNAACAARLAGDLPARVDRDHR